ncbi:unnamed protein product [Leptidea sinapis]|uniref:15-hydroxyprostaglandin dehydrogenase [NAD(+)]-like n=1 Tax=Leptidea sinapis TaxID=189913 RepID=A0A5E4PUF5_9NEOP|nr:unnamed protein product [Leptidea sinapis]
MCSVSNKTILITGGANGIGEFIVREALEKAAKHVTILDIDADSGHKLEAELNEKYGENKINYILCDITNEKELFNAFNIAIEMYNSTLDVVINNAAILDDSPDMYKKEIEINFTATVASTLKALEKMRKDEGGEGGTVINISSMSALHQLSPSYYIYAATKSAVLHFSNCIGMDNYYERTKVRVLTVCFGSTQTNIANNFRLCDKKITKEEIIEVFKEYKPGQSAEAAAKGTLEVYSKGKSGSTWLVNNNQVKDITSYIKRAYAVLKEGIKTTAIS